MRAKFIVIFLFASMIAKSQDRPMLSLKQQEISVYNPAFTGLEKLHRFQLHHRKQWIGFDGAPGTQVLSYSGNYFKSVGVGGYFYYDAVGPIKNYGANVAFAHHIDLESTSIAFGLSMSLSQIVYDFKEIGFENNYDPLAYGADVVKSKIRPDFTGGVIWYGQKHIIGLSMNYRLKNKVKEDYDISVSQDQHYYLFANYSFPAFKENVILTPNVFGMLNSNSKYQIEAGVRSKILNTALFGISYRTDQAIILSAGIKFLKMFEFNYAYDYSFANVGEYYKSSHEIILICRLKKLTKVFSKSRDKQLKQYDWL